MRAIFLTCELLAPEGVIEAFVFEEFNVASLFDEFAVFEDEDSVRVFDRRETVGDEYYQQVRFVLLEIFYRGGDFFFCD